MQILPLQTLRDFPRLATRALPLAGALVTTALPAAAQPEALRAPAGYQLAWSDEFDVDGLPDARKWVHETVRNKIGWHNNELQYYAGPRTANANAIVQGGRLLITARKETLATAADWGGQRYTSARLITKDRADWTYGFFEIRAKLPCGQGTWPAIWTLGSHGEWPERGELDIMEQLGSDPSRITSVVHTSAGHAAQGVIGASRVNDACDQFHRYQMHWTADGVEFGVDGFSHLRYPNLKLGPRAWPFDAPQFLLLNIAIGGDLGGKVDDRIFPVAMEIDYVRVYQARVAASPR